MFRLIFFRKKTVFLTLGCDPGEALILREIFSSVTPGDHMDKDHWSTIALDGIILSGEVARIISNSYTLVTDSFINLESLSLSSAY